MIVCLIYRMGAKTETRMRVIAASSSTEISRPKGIKGKLKCAIPHGECRRGARLPSLGRVSPHHWSDDGDDEISDRC